MHHLSRHPSVRMRGVCLLLAGVAATAALWAAAAPPATSTVAPGAAGRPAVR